MPDDIKVAPAAPAPTSSPAPSPAPVVSTPVPKAEPGEVRKPIVDLDEALREEFKKHGADTDDVSKKPTPKEKVEPVSKPKGEEAKPQEPTPKNDTTPAKIVDPEAIKYDANNKRGSWDVMRDNSKVIFNENKKLQTKVKELESVVTQKQGLDTKEVEALKKEVDELRGLRSMVDTEHDPEFVKNFDGPLQERREDISTLLKALEVNDATISGIDYANRNHVNAVFKALKDAGREAEADEFLTLARDVLNLSRKRGKALDESRTKYKEFSKERQAKEATSKTEQEAQMNQALEAALTATDEEGNPEVPVLAIRDISATASKEERAKIEKHNQVAELLQGKVRALANDSSPQRRALVARAAVVGAVLEAQNAGLRSRITELEDELGRVSAAGSTRKESVSNVDKNLAPPKDAEEALSRAFPNMK